MESYGVKCEQKRKNQQITDSGQDTSMKYPFYLMFLPETPIRYLIPVNHKIEKKIHIDSSNIGQSVSPYNKTNKRSRDPTFLLSCLIKDLLMF